MFIVPFSLFKILKGKAFGHLCPIDEPTIRLLFCVPLELPFTEVVYLKHSNLQYLLPYLCLSNVALASVNEADPPVKTNEPPNHFLVALSGFLI